MRNAVLDMCQEIVDHTGWNDRTLLELATRFIEERDLLHHFEAYLEGIADEEGSEEEEEDEDPEDFEDEEDDG